MARGEIYNDKEHVYYTGARPDLIDRLSADSRRLILEIGCGDGATGAYAKRTGRCDRYVGVELSIEAADVARGVLDQVVLGDIEDTELPFGPHTFDVLIASEVLEHLVDPWAVLRKLRPLLKPGATVFASSPNIAHRTTFEMLLKGRWDLDPEGRMDRTHLRWFTPKTYAQLFIQTGFEIISVGPLRRPGIGAQIFNTLSGHRLSHLFVSQIEVEARTPALDMLSAQGTH